MLPGRESRDSKKDQPLELNVVDKSQFSFVSSRIEGIGSKSLTQFNMTCHDRL